MEKLVVTLLVWPPNEHVTVAVPPLPFDSMCQVHPTTPLLSTIRAEPSNDRGARPVEYTTLAVQTAPTAVLAYSVAYALTSVLPRRQCAILSLMLSQAGSFD
jgi:hypothetical protein